MLHQSAIQLRSPAGFSDDSRYGVGIFSSNRKRLRFVGIAILLVVLAGCADADLLTEPQLGSAPQPRLNHTLFTVINTEDDGDGSLRQAIRDATLAGPAIIQFDPGLAGERIVLLRELSVSSTITLEGPVDGGITIDANGTDRVLLAGQLSDLVLRNLTITGGKTASGGAGLFIAGGAVTLENVTVTGNFAQFGGGGIYASGARLTLINSTISGNVAASGAGILIDYNSEEGENITELISSTIAHNTATEITGGLVRTSVVWGPFTLRNVVIANNTGPVLDNCSLGGGNPVDPIFEGTNLFGDDSCEPRDSDIVADPLLGPLADNGGPNWTHALLRDSPAIDSATDCNVTEDQRYVSRPIGAACDIGAYEFEDFATVSLTLDRGEVDPKTGVARLTGTMTCSEQVTIHLEARLSQDQKVRRVPIVVEASAVEIVECAGSNAWIIDLLSPTGPFHNGTATASVEVISPNWIYPVTAGGPIKLFWARK